MLQRALIIAAVTMASLPAAANDTMATLGAGGLVFIETGDVKMLTEDLYVSAEEIRVTYRFRNDGASDSRTLVAFPMPDITGSPDFMVSVPTENGANLFDFETRVDGALVDARQHQYAFANNIDYSQTLRKLGVPLVPFGGEVLEAIESLDEATQASLFRIGLVAPLEYDSGQGWERHFYPVWTLRSAYSWEAEFPAGEEVVVEHRYRPSVGGTVAVTFLSPPYEGYDPATTYRQKYCTDDAFIRAVERTLPNPAEPYGAPFTESWLTYVWSTGGNWSGPIGEFHLTIDKGRPENLVSFCWDGEVTKTSPTTFEMTAHDWYPPWGRELEVLILQRTE